MSEITLGTIIAIAKYWANKIGTAAGTGNVHTSSAGLKVASLELDIDVTWETSSSPYGSYRCAYTLQELLPVDVFLTYPNVNVMCYCTNQNYSFLTLPIAPPSTTYMGKWQTIMLDAAGTGENQPTKIHYVINATGF